jgi:hypothetical protein
MAKTKLRCPSCNDILEIKFEVGKPIQVQMCSKCNVEMVRIYDDIDTGQKLPDNVSYAGNKILWAGVASGKDRSLI